MFRMTHRSEINGGTYTVYRDRERGRTVTHYTARRGGCLYLGEVVVMDTVNILDFAFSTTSPPWSDERGPEAAENLWNKNQHKMR